MQPWIHEKGQFFGVIFSQFFEKYLWSWLLEHILRSWKVSTCTSVTQSGFGTGSSLWTQRSSLGEVLGRHSDIESM